MALCRVFNRGLIVESSVLKPFKYALLVFIGVAFAVGVSKVFYPLVSKRAELLENRNMHRMDNDEVGQRIADLRRKQIDFSNDPEYVELVSRREGLVRKNEIVFDFKYLNAK